MPQTWSVPFPESKTEHNGYPVYWRYFETVQEAGIEVIAEQYIAFHQTNSYAFLCPAHWAKNYDIARDKAQWLDGWKKKNMRYAIKKVAKSAERSFAFPSQQLALESLLRRKKYHLRRLNQDIAIITTVVEEMKNLDLSSPQIGYNFGHNAETETWTFF
ncbi:hypothetical protein BV923_09595 [Pectobacterium odoriferum]|uniref:hypothetical protein n=1 Tax=Pectobacterium odoriferum TaxID=78398 RepID=UPI000CD11804|nr:hypothetical protein [Pectobacterium odoriferum]POE22829.1 hypothetical protein BV923_09595 [Pectobacterium odoriferum]